MNFSAVPETSVLPEVEEGSEIQNHPWLHREFEDSLGYIRP